MIDNPWNLPITLYRVGWRKWELWFFRNDGGMMVVKEYSSKRKAEKARDWWTEWIRGRSSV